MHQSFPSEEFLARWLDGTLSEAELRAWEASDHFKELQPVLAVTEGLAVPATRSRAEAWEALKLRLHTKAEVSQPAAKRRWLWAGISLAAAAAVAILVFVFYPLPTTQQFQTGPGEQLTVNLPAGSAVYLNAVSSLSFDLADWEEQRHLSLEGEAYFDVTPGQPFLVTTPLGQVSVLGTTFNVKIRSDEAEVRCLSGKVQIEAGKRQTFISAGEGVSWDQSGQIRTFTHQIDSPDWLRGLFRFKDAPLSQVCAELQRQYGVKVQLHESAQNRTYTGAFRKGELQTALHNICDPLGLSFLEENNSEIRIFSPINQ